MARAAENAGFDAFFRSDHFLVMGKSDGLPGPTDAWLTLAALARETNNIRLGTLVTSATFRHPGMLAVSVAQVDAMSGGRVELGLGAGWYQAEHAAYGVPFPPLVERFDRLEEQLAVITGLWDVPAGEKFSYSGSHFQVANSPGLPKPIQSPHPPIIIGGSGPRRTPDLAARYAAEFNMAFASIDKAREQQKRVDQACERAGRDPNTLIRSAVLVTCCGRNEQEISHRANAIGRQVDELRTNGAAGSPAELIDKIGTYADIGMTRVYLQLLDLNDLEHVELLGKDVLAHL